MKKGGKKYTTTGRLFCVRFRLSLCLVLVWEGNKRNAKCVLSTLLTRRFMRCLPARKRGRCAPSPLLFLFSSAPLCLQPTDRQAGQSTCLCSCGLLFSCAPVEIVARVRQAALDRGTQTRAPQKERETAKWEKKKRVRVRPKRHNVHKASMGRTCDFFFFCANTPGRICAPVSFDSLVACLPPFAPNPITMV